MSKEDQGTDSETQDANEPFDLSQFLSNEEIERPAEDADFGDDPESSFQETEDDSENDSTQSGESEETEETREEETDSDAEAESEESSETEESETDTTESEPQSDELQQKKDPTIPKRRLDSEIAKRRQVEQELKEARRQQQETQQQLKEREKVPEETIQQWLQESAQKALDGETEESAKLQQKAFDALSTNRGDGQQESQQQIDPDELVQRVEERVEVKNTVKDVFDAYPQLDPNSDSFDEGMNEEVMELNDFYTGKGYTQSAAVEKSVEVLAAQRGLKPANADTQSAPEKPQKKPSRNTNPDVEKKMDVAKKQPSEPSSRRSNKQDTDDTVDIANLSDDEYMALPDQVKARLRGD